MTDRPETREGHGEASLGEAQGEDPHGPITDAEPDGDTATDLEQDPSRNPPDDALKDLKGG